MLLYTVTSTFLYFQQAEIVGASFEDRAARTVFFASVDLAVNTLTVLTQIFLTGRIVRPTCVPPNRSHNRAVTNPSSMGSR